MSFIELLDELSRDLTFNLPDLRGRARADRFNPAEPRDKSGKWTGGAGESGKTEWGTVNWNDVRDIELAKHPSIDDIATLSKEDKFGAVRLIKDDNGDVYAWPADNAIHQQVASGLDFELGPSNGATHTRIVWKQGRKFVSHQSMDGWLREGTIKQIGPNEGSAPSGPAAEVRGPGLSWTPENLNKFHAAATYAAVKLGYNANKVYTSTDTYKFTLNGTERRAAGAAYIKGGAMYRDPSNNHKYEKGDIVLYASGFDQTNFADTSHVPSVIAHEIEHQKFQQVLDQKAAEYKQIEAEMDRIEAAGKDSWRDGPLKADGTVRDTYRGRWPAYEALAATMDSNMTKLKTDDGVTAYSREWWDAYTKGKGNVSYESAMHETLAEMAYNETLMGGEKRLLGPADEEGNYTKSATGGSKVWRDLYAAVGDVWNRSKAPS